MMEVRQNSVEPFNVTSIIVEVDSKEALDILPVHSTADDRAVGGVVEGVCIHG